MSEINNVSVVTKANVYFDGKCVSHTVQFSDGSKKSVGVILPATLTFNTGAPEMMEGVAGSCRVRMKGETDWKVYSAGESYKVPADSSFDIEVAGEPYHYICHFG
ncbi:MAG: pyrimidine/purine nucleoside phosphorylase [Thiobacillaceae bacterium]